MFQQLCKEGKDWNEKLPVKLFEKFQEWLLKATKIPNTEIEWCYTKNLEIKKILLVGIYDASKFSMQLVSSSVQNIQMNPDASKWPLQREGLHH